MFPESVRDACERLCEDHVESILASMSWGRKGSRHLLCEVRTPRWKI